jgi:heme exporter protein D
MGATAHINFIAAAYTAAVITIACLIAWVIIDYRAQRHALAELEKRGITRRSAPTRAAGSMQQAREDA